MAIALDNSGKGDSGGSSPISVSYTCTGSNLVLVVITLGNVGTDNVTSVTYNSVGLSLIQTATTPSDRVIDLWMLTGPATGANTLTINFTGTFCRYAVASYTGCAQSGQPDSSNTGTATSAHSPQSISTTVVASNCWLIGAVKDASGDTGAGTGTTLRQNLGVATSGGLFDSNATVGTGSQSLSFTDTVDPDGYGMVIASLAPLIVPPDLVDIENPLVAQLLIH